MRPYCQNGHTYGCTTCGEQLPPPTGLASGAAEGTGACHEALPSGVEGALHAYVLAHLAYKGDNSTEADREVGAAYESLRDTIFAYGAALTAELARVTAERDDARHWVGEYRDLLAAAEAERDAALQRAERAEREREAAREEIRTTLLADEERRKLTGDALAAEAERNASLAALSAVREALAGVVGYLDALGHTPDVCLVTPPCPLCAARRALSQPGREGGAR